LFKQQISVADLSPSARETALKNGALIAYDPSEADVVKRIIKETEGGFDEIVDFAGNDRSLGFAISVLVSSRREDRCFGIDGRKFQSSHGAMDL